MGLDQFILDDVHAPFLRRLLAAQDWAGLVRYWIGHDYKPALRTAVRIVQEKQIGNDTYLFLGVQLSIALVNPFQLGWSMPTPEGNWTEEQRVTLELLVLYPTIALCERAADQPLERQVAMFSAGLQAASRACEIAAEVNDRALLAFHRSMMGSAFAQLRQLESARACLDEAVQLRRALWRDRPAVYGRELAMTMNILGTLQIEANEIEAARESFREAVDLYREALPQNPAFASELAGCLQNVAVTHRRLRQSAQAVALLREATAILRVSEQRSVIAQVNLANCLTNLGNAMREHGDGAAAIAPLEEAVAIMRRIGDSKPAHQRTLASMIGNLAAAQESFAKAAESLAEVVAMYRPLAERQPFVYGPLLATALTNFALSQRDNDEPEAARDSLREAVDWFEKDAQSRPQTFLTERVGCYYQLGNLLRSDAETVRDLPAAREALRSARACAELLRGLLSDSAQRNRAQGEALRVYDALFRTNVDLANAGDHPALHEAVEVAEAIRGRLLNDLLAHEQLVPANAPADVVTRFEVMRSGLRQAERLLYHASREGNNEIDPELDATVQRLTSEYRQALTEIQEQFDPEFDPDVPVPSVSFESIQQLLPVDVPTAIVQYTIGVDSATAIVVSKTEAIAVALPELNEQSANALGSDWFLAYGRRRTKYLEGLHAIKHKPAGKRFDPTQSRLIQNLRALVDSGVLRGVDPSTDSMTEAAKAQPDAELWFADQLEKAVEHGGGHLAPEWSEVLPHLLEPVGRFAIDPVVPVLRKLGVLRVIFSANKALHVFPLHACELSPGCSLADEFEVLYAPSLSVLQRCAARQRTVREKLVAIENPTLDLPGSELEVAAAAIYYADLAVLTGRQATKDAVLATSADAHVLLYSGHSKFNPGSPMNSALVLVGHNSPAEWLTVGEVFGRLRLPKNQLTILSGCEGGMLVPDRVDEYLSLASGFLHAGARSVISSLWETYDLPQMLLIDRFHSEWTDGVTVVAALRRAQLWLRSVSSGEQLLSQVLPTFLERVNNADLHRLARKEAQVFASASGRPFASPAYWAGLIVTGWGTAEPEKPVSTPRSNVPRRTRASRETPPVDRETMLSEQLKELGPEGAPENAKRILDRTGHYSKRRALKRTINALERLGFAEDFSKLRRSLTMISDGAASLAFDRAISQLSEPTEDPVSVLERSLAAAVEEGQAGLISLNVVVLGLVHLSGGYTRQAIAHFRRALPGCPRPLRTNLAKNLIRALQLQTDEAFEEVEALVEAGTHAAAIQDFQQRVLQASDNELFERLISEARELADPTRMFLVQVAKVQRHLKENNLASADAALAEVLVAVRQMAAGDDTPWFALYEAGAAARDLTAEMLNQPERLYESGLEHLKAGQPEQALVTFRAAAEQTFGDEDARTRAMILVGYSRSLMDLDQMDAAVEQIQLASEVAKRANETDLVRDTARLVDFTERERRSPSLSRLGNRAMELLHSGRRLESVEVLRRALRVAEQGPDRAGHAACARVLATTLAEVGQPVNAEEVLTAGLKAAELAQDASLSRAMRQMLKAVAPLASRLRSAESQLESISSDDSPLARCERYCTAAERLTSTDPVLSHHFALRAALIADRQSSRPLRVRAAVLIIETALELGRAREAADYLAFAERQLDLTDGVDRQRFAQIAARIAAAVGKDKSL